MPRRGAPSAARQPGATRNGCADQLRLTGDGMNAVVNTSCVCAKLVTTAYVRPLPDASNVWHCLYTQRVAARQEASSGGADKAESPAQQHLQQVRRVVEVRQRDEQPGQAAHGHARGGQRRGAAAGSARHGQQPLQCRLPQGGCQVSLGTMQVRHSWSTRRRRQCRAARRSRGRQRERHLPHQTPGPPSPVCSGAVLLGSCKSATIAGSSKYESVPRSTQPATLGLHQTMPSWSDGSMLDEAGAPSAYPTPTLSSH